MTNLLSFMIYPNILGQRQLFRGICAVRKQPEIVRYNINRKLNHDNVIKLAKNDILPSQKLVKFKIIKVQICQNWDFWQFYLHKSDRNRSELQKWSILPNFFAKAASDYSSLLESIHIPLSDSLKLTENSEFHTKSSHCNLVIWFVRIGISS